MIFSIDKTEPSRAALLAENGQVVTYGELTRHSARIGEMAGGKCLVFCLCANRPGSVVGYTGFLSSGIVPLLLDARIDDGILERFRELYRPSLFWVPEEIEIHDAKRIYAVLGYTLWKTEEAPYPLHPDLGLLLATSGSTGSPKLVRLSVRGVEANAAAIREYLGLTEMERPITTLPMNYSYGLSILNSHLLAGAQVLLTEHGMVQKEFWDFFISAGATSFGGVPYTYEILRKMRFTRMSLPSLRSMTQAGGHLPEALQKEFGEWAAGRGVRFYVMYGQTEATARMSYIPPEKCLNKIGSVGRAITGGAFHLIDAAGNVIENPGEVGELVYSGPNVSLGYAENTEDLGKGDERGGVLRTGDYAKRDEEGYYYIVGRAKRFIKLYGVRVSLDECEKLLKERFRDADFACAGADDHLIIYATKEETRTPSEEYLASTTRLNRKAFQCKVINAIPRNKAGKILYSELGGTRDEQDTF